MVEIGRPVRKSSVLRRRSLGSSRNLPPLRTNVGEQDCVMSPKIRLQNVLWGPMTGIWRRFYEKNPLYNMPAGIIMDFDQNGSKSIKSWKLLSYKNQK
jgi:hypothetical protein